MILIGENIHIISKQVCQALEKKDEIFVKNLIKIQQKMDCIDLNIGPARGKLDKIFNWLIPLAGTQNISLDTTNIDAIKEGLAIISNPENCFINSTSADNEKLEPLCELALKYGCNLIALATSKEKGIPKTADERMELIFEIYEYCIAQGISPNKLFFDPLVLPIKVDNTQAFEAINTIKMINESFNNEVNTVIGLSNVSNGIIKDYRKLFNQVYAVLCNGAGLSSAIVDANDEELIRIINMLEKNSAKSETDNLYQSLSNMIKSYGSLKDVNYNKKDKSQELIIKTSEILLGQKIYSDSFAQV